MASAVSAGDDRGFSGNFDCDTGNAPFVLRTTTVPTNAWFDAIAPYSDTALGVYSSIPRRPEF